jgi:hypothetical protein
MKKPFLSVLLCLALFLGMATTALAAPAYVTDPAKIRSYHGSLVYEYDGTGFITAYDAFTEK